MAQYISKSDVVAEIERLISNGQIKLKESEECKDYESYVALAERIATCINILSFLNTLEVKEVDLDMEIERFVKSDKFQKACGTIKVTNLLAKHFFELGLKAQKGK